VSKIWVGINESWRKSKASFSKKEQLLLKKKTTLAETADQLAAELLNICYPIFPLILFPKEKLRKETI
jgi:hypothetical protein